MKRMKKVDGLGFRDLLCFNLAFLAKIGWRVMMNPTSLLARVFKKKYYSNRPFMEENKGGDLRGVGKVYIRDIVFWSEGLR